jgi:hypothetical protein
MSRLAMTGEQRAEVETAQRQSRTVRHWNRSQAVLLRADGMPLAVVAQTLGCSRVSVSQWTRAGRAAGGGRRAEVACGKGYIQGRRADGMPPVSSGWQSC